MLTLLKLNSFARASYINNFKSLSRFRIKDIGNFAAFAGSNGSGKSNFFDALNFISQFVSMGLEDAVSQQGGYQNFKPIRKAIGKACTLNFEISSDLTENNHTKTYMKHASDGNLQQKDLAPLGLDEVWLSNLLGSGNPW